MVKTLQEAVDNWASKMKNPNTATKWAEGVKNAKENNLYAIAMQQFFAGTPVANLVASSVPVANWNDFAANADKKKEVFTNSVKGDLAASKYVLGLERAFSITASGTSATTTTTSGGGGGAGGRTTGGVRIPSV